MTRIDRHFAVVVMQIFYDIVVINTKYSANQRTKSDTFNNEYTLAEVN